MNEEKILKAINGALANYSISVTPADKLLIGDRWVFADRILGRSIFELEFPHFAERVFHTQKVGIIEKILEEEQLKFATAHEFRSDGELSEITEQYSGEVQFSNLAKDIVNFEGGFVDISNRYPFVSFSSKFGSYEFSSLKYGSALSIEFSVREIMPMCVFSEIHYGRESNLRRNISANLKNLGYEFASGYDPEYAIFCLPDGLESEKEVRLVRRFLSPDSEVELEKALSHRDGPFDEISVNVQGMTEGYVPIGTSKIGTIEPMAIHCFEAGADEAERLGGKFSLPVVVH